MLKNRRTHSGLREARHDTPAHGQVDSEISKDYSTLGAIEEVPEALESTKNFPAPTLATIIEQRTWENGRLRQQLAREQKRHEGSMYLVEEVRCAMELLQKALAAFQQSSDDLFEDEIASIVTAGPD